MSKYVFKSKYSIEEIEDNFRNVDLFDGIEAGLKEALAYEKGSAKAETLVRKRNILDIEIKS